MSEKDLSELYDRLRETEAQTREQNVSIKALCEKCDELSNRFKEQMEKMWRLVFILVGVVVAIALGPKAADKIMASINGGVTCVQPIAPWNEYDLYHRT